MTGTPAERAALLSARIHREINEGRKWTLLLSAIEPDDSDKLCGGYCADGVYRNPFARLGAELRAIALGNRGGAR